MALQDAVGYRNNVAIEARGLLPHIFTLTAVLQSVSREASCYAHRLYYSLVASRGLDASAAVILCYPCINSSPICAFHSALLSPARTFLPIT